MRHAGRGAGQPLRCRLSAINSKGRKVLSKALEGAVKRVAAEPRSEPGQGILHCARIALPAILFCHGVQRLINQAHGIQRSGMHCALRMIPNIARQVYPMGEFTAGGEVREDDVAAEREQAIGKTAAVPHHP